jgi:hypothetical protein
MASDDHEDLQKQLNQWVQDAKPARIFNVQLVADGAKYTYCALVMYVAP